MATREIFTCDVPGCGTEVESKTLELSEKLGGTVSLFRYTERKGYANEKRVGHGDKNEPWELCAKCCAKVVKVLKLEVPDVG